MLRSLPGPARAAAVAVAIAIAITLIDLGPGFDLTRYLRVGEQASARSFVEADLPETHLVPGWGHDGQAKGVLSRALPDLTNAEGHLDSVTYRARRIIYPALTSPRSARRRPWPDSPRSTEPDGWPAPPSACHPPFSPA